MADTTDALRPPFMQRCYTCGRESPAGPLLHDPGCLVGAGTQAYLDAVATYGCKVTTAALQAEVAQLQAALAEARRDTERLDWAHDYAHALSWNHDGERIVIRGEDGAEFTGESWRECIDAALHQRKENGHAG